MTPSPRLRSRPAALFLAAALAGVPAPSPASAQEGVRSILSLLDPEDRRLRSGSTVEGTLSLTDFFTPEGRPVQAWAYDGTADEAVTFDLVSDDFDAVLFLLGPGLPGVLLDDDGGGGCNSRLTLTLPATGRYLLVASAYGITGPSRFTLSASAEPGPPTGSGGCGAGSAWDPMVFEALDTGGRTIGLQEESRGVLSEADRREDGSLMQAWRLEGREGAPVTVDLISDDFDAFLLLSGPGLPEVLADDDGGGACHARISLTLPETGDYRLVVSTVGDPGDGAFLLRTSPEPGPLAEGHCGTYDQILGFLESELGAADVGTRRLPAEGGEVRDTLLEGDPRYPGGGGPMHVWLLQGRQGASVTIDLVSDDFDAFLTVTGPGLVPSLSDDDGGDGFNSRLTFTFPADGDFRVVATSVGQGTGAYLLRVTPEP